MNHKITVVGGGSWGTALANHLANLGHETSMLVQKPQVAQTINRSHINPEHLSSFSLNKSIKAETEFGPAIKKSDVIVIAIPCQAWRAFLKENRSNFLGNQIIVSCSKGIETESLKLISEIVEEIVPKPTSGRFVTVAGPSFAKEVMEGDPTAVTAAGTDSHITKIIQQIFHGKNLRVYSSKDLVGVEISGALKNVIAIATGISDGLGFGHNARAALITRGLAEIRRFGIAKGASQETLLGLSGIGDLVLTCTGELSRNRTVGFRMGKGETLEHILETLGEVSEGVTTSKSAHALAKKLGIAAPITEEVYKILYQKKKPLDSLRSLMDREIRAELDNV